MARFHETEPSFENEKNESRAFESECQTTLQQKPNAVAHAFHAADC